MMNKYSLSIQDWPIYQLAHTEGFIQFDHDTRTSSPSRMWNSLLDIEARIVKIGPLSSSLDL